MVWREELNDWDDTWRGWIKSLKEEEDVWRLLKMAITRFPNWLCPFNYHGSVLKYGLQAPLAPHNLWRQLFHLVGGIFLGLLSFYMGGVIVGLVFILFCLLEAITLVNETIENQSILKSSMDIFFWTLGSAVSTTIMIGDQLWQ